MWVQRTLMIGLLSALCAAATISAAEWKDGLLLYAGFDSSADADVAQGARRASGSNERAGGRVGQAIRIAPNETLQYNNVANLDLSAGTVAFWVKPDRDLREQGGNWSLFRAVHLAATYTDASKVLFFMTGSNDPEKGFAWDYSLASNKVNDWEKGEFHHVALTWNRKTGEKSLYLDGMPEGTKKTSRLPDTIAAAAPLEFGVGAPGIYDEIAVWNRPLDAAEVSFFAARPETVAETLLALKAPEKTVPPPDAAPYQEKAAFHVSFEDGTAPDFSSGSYRNTPRAASIAAAGIAGHGAKLAGVDFDSTGVIAPESGTVSFWVNPQEGFLPPEKESYALFRAGHLALTLFRNGVNFMTGRTRDGKFQWNYSCGSDRPCRWKPNTWHHVTITWNRAAKRKTLWLDGEMVSSAETDAFPDAIQPAGEFTFGAAPGIYDELTAWNRVLSPTEILRLAAFPDLAGKAFGKTSEPVKNNLDFQRRSREKLADSGNPLGSLRFPIYTPAPEESIVEPGETFRAEVRIENPSIVPVESSVKLTLRDFHMNPVAADEAKFQIPAGESTVISREYKVAKRGIYKLEAVLPDGSVRDVASFGCWQKTQKPDPESFFGNHVNSWADGRYLRQAAKLGQNWMRNHNMLQAVWWTKVQPEPGAFTWTEDDVLKRLKEMEMPVLGQLFTTPNWAAAGGPRPPTKGYNQCLKPDYKAFEEYVYQTVSRYKGQIKYWEIWNEPDVSMFWKATPEEFAELVQAGVKAAHRADPDAVVMAGGYTSSARAWHRRAAKAGAFKHLDAASFHAYLPGNMEAEERFERLQSTVNHFRSLVAEYGDGRELPLWDSEGGAGTTTFLRGVELPMLPPPEKRAPLNWRQAALGMVQFEAMLLSEGIVKNFLYFQNPISPNSAEAYENLSSLDINQAPKPFLMARAAMQEQLDYTRFYALLRKESYRFFAFVFQHKTDPGQSRVLLWCGPGGKLELSARFPGKVEGVDLMGNPAASGPVLTVTEEPCYLRINAPAKEVRDALEHAEFKLLVAPAPLRKKEAATGHGIPQLADFAAPAEAPAKVFTVDLRKFCTMGLADDKPGDGKGGWADEGNLNDMSDLKTGRRNFYGVPFELIDPATNGGKAVVTLRSRNLTPTLPEAAERIPVNRKVRNLYFLHAAAWGTPGEIGDYVIRYADGSKETIGIEIPRNCNNWWQGFSENEESRPVPVRVTNTPTDVPAWRYLRILEWQNPKMDVPIESIDFRSRNDVQTPILLAVSGVEL